jgi:hypothetical protein
LNALSITALTWLPLMPPAATSGSLLGRTSGDPLRLEE